MEFNRKLTKLALKQFRRQAELTQMQLSERLSYSLKTIEDWESLKTDKIPDEETLGKMMALYNTTIDKILIYDYEGEVELTKKKEIENKSNDLYSISNDYKSTYYKVNKESEYGEFIIELEEYKECFGENSYGDVIDLWIFNSEYGSKMLLGGELVSDMVNESNILQLYSPLIDRIIQEYDKKYKEEYIEIILPTKLS